MEERENNQLRLAALYRRMGDLWSEDDITDLSIVMNSCTMRFGYTL